MDMSKYRVYFESTLSLDNEIANYLFAMAVDKSQSEATLTQINLCIYKFLEYLEYRHHMHVHYLGNLHFTEILLTGEVEVINKLKVFTGFDGLSTDRREDITSRHRLHDGCSTLPAFRDFIFMTENMNIFSIYIEGRQALDRAVADRIRDLYEPEIVEALVPEVREVELLEISKTEIKQNEDALASASGFGQKHDASVDKSLDAMKEIKRGEEAVASAGVPVDERNWPPFFPIIHHDIRNEIPAHAQKLQYLAFASWLGIVLYLMFNGIAVTISWIRGDGVKIFFLAIICALMGSPLSYVLWNRPLYRAMRTDSALKFGSFILFYMLYIPFCIIAEIATQIVFQGKSLTDILAAVHVLSGHILDRILYLIGFAFFWLESLLSLWLQKVRTYFRGNK